MNEKLIELAKKLKALADRGVGGEKENATAMLERLMKKHGISLADIEGDQIRSHELKYSGKDKQFCRQVISSVLGSLRGKVFEYKSSYSRAKVLIIECTEAEFLLIDAKIDFYWKAYQEELEVFYSAFIQKNALWRKQDENEKEEKQPLSPEEKAKLLRMVQLMEGINSHVMNPMLTEGGN